MMGMMRILESMFLIYLMYFKYLKRGTMLKKIRHIRLNIDKLKDITMDCEKNEDYYSFFKYNVLKWFLMSVYMKLTESKSKVFKSKQL